jgi:superfamily II DNA or RNA helicase
MEGYIYILLNYLFRKYDFKIGSTENPYGRYKSYGGYYPRGEYYFKYLIKIKSVPKIYKRNKSQLKDCEYVEKEILHHHFKTYAIPSTHCHEWFCKEDTIENIFKEVKSLLDSHNIQYEFAEDPDISANQYKAINKQKGILYKLNKKEEYYDEEKDTLVKRIFYIWCFKSCPIKTFVEKIILKGNLREPQQMILDFLEGKKITNFKHLIKAPTGIGKRICIIICILFQKKNYGNLRCVLAAPKNDIYGDKAKKEYQYLELIGIKVIDGTHGNFKKIKKQLSKYSSYLLITTHQALALDKNYEKIDIDFLIYDEVHYITGETLYKKIQDNLPRHLLGVSATPYTGDKEQNRKMDTLFEENFILNYSFKKAINSGYILTPKIKIYLVNNLQDFLKNQLTPFIKNVVKTKEQENTWQGKKIIVYTPKCKSYKNIAYDSFDYHQIEKFDDNCIQNFEESNNPDGSILFCCRKCREGSDFKNLDCITIVINHVEEHILEQTMGRVLRKDYPNQEGLVNIIIIKNPDKGDNTQLMEIIDKIKTSLELDDDDIQNMVECYDGLPISNALSEEIMKLNEEKERDIQKQIELIKREYNEKIESLQATKLESMNLIKYNSHIMIKGALDMINYGGNLNYEDFLKLLKTHRIENHRQYNQFRDTSTLNLPVDYMNEYPDFSWSQSQVNSDYYTHADEVLKSIINIKYTYYEEINLLDQDDEQVKQDFCHSKDSKIPTYISGSLGNYYNNKQLCDI